MGGLNWLDWIFVIIVAVSVLAAAWRGFVHELISLASVVAGVVVAALGYRQAAVWFEDLTKSNEVALAAGFLALFLGTLLVGALLIYAARKLIKTAGIQWFDRFLGGVFGLVRGVVVNSVLLMVLVAFAIKPEVVQHSALSPYVAMGARVLATAMPAGLKAQFRAGFEKFHQALIESDRKVKKQ
jgi:membrane protein required for colicin V production